jgi:hypothetical protein
MAELLCVSLSFLMGDCWQLSGLHLFKNSRLLGGIKIDGVAVDEVGGRLGRMAVDELGLVLDQRLDCQSIR